MIQSTLNQLAAQEKTRREILHKSELIPPLPDLVVRLLAILNNPDTEPHDLEALMQNDQVLVAKMLAMVNSPFYGLSRPISTVRDAVMVLGFRGVRSLVLATSAAKVMQRDFACYGHEPRGLWLHAASVAAGARHIAQSCKMGAEAAEQLFVGGLLHDIGKLMLVPYFNEKRQTVKEQCTLVEFERELVGVDHTEAGALITAKWNLSDEIQAVIKAHHDSPAVGETDDPVPQPVAVVRLANAIAHGTGLGYLPGMCPKAKVLPADLASLGLDEQSWTVLRDEVTSTMETAVQALVNLGS